MADEINIVVRADDLASAAMQGVAIAADGLLSSTNAVRNGFEVFANIITGLRNGIDLLAGAFNNASEFVGKFVDSAAESEVALTKLNTVFNSMGGNAGITQYQLEALAKGLQNVTVYSDEAAMGAEAMLLRFENINANIFPETLKLTADIATSLGVDLTSAARMVGMALDDPEKGIGRLNTAYRIFNDSQMEVIKKMAATGDLAGAQALIMQGLTEKFGGAAEAIGTTFTGQLEIAKNKIDDVKELIGGAFLPVLKDLLDMFIGYASNPQVIEFFASLATSISEAIVSIESLFISPSPSRDIFTTYYVNGMTLSEKIGTEIKPAILKSFDEIVAGVQNTIAQWFSNIDLAAAAKDVSTQVAIAINAVDWNTIGLKFNQGFQLVIDGLVVVVQNTDWRALSQALGHALSGVVVGSFGYVSWKDLGVDFWNGVAFALTGQANMQAFKDSVYNAMLNIGEMIFDAITTPFKNFATAFNIVKNFFAELIRVVQESLEIASPSQVFLRIGQNIVQGLMLGIAGMLGEMLAYIGAVVTLLLAPFKPILDLLGIDISGLSGGSAGGGVSLSGTSTGGLATGGGSSGQVVNNYYGPVYFQGGAEPGSYYDCPSPNPLMTAGTGTLGTHAI